MNKDNNKTSNNSCQKQTPITQQNKTLKRVRRKEPMLSRISKNRGK